MSDSETRGVEPEDLPCIVRHYKDPARRYLAYTIAVDKTNGRDEGTKRVIFRTLYEPYRTESRTWVDSFMKLSERGPRFILERELSSEEALELLKKYW